MFPDTEDRRAITKVVLFQVGFQKKYGIQTRANDAKHRVNAVNDEA